MLPPSSTVDICIDDLETRRFLVASFNGIWWIVWIEVMICDWCQGRHERDYSDPDPVSDETNISPVFRTSNCWFRRSQETSSSDKSTKVEELEAILKDELCNREISESVILNDDILFVRNQKLAIQSMLTLKYWANTSLNEETRQPSVSRSSMQMSIIYGEIPDFPRWTSYGHLAKNELLFSSVFGQPHGLISRWKQGFSNSDELAELRRNRFVICPNGVTLHSSF